MTTTVNQADLEAAARELAETNHYFEEGIVRTYWFADPAGEQVRLVHIDANNPFRLPTIRPFYFVASMDKGVYTPASAIALVNPDDEKRLALPDGWGEWDTATAVWEWDNSQLGK